MKSELKTTLVVACVFVSIAIFVSFFNLSNDFSLTGNVVSEQKAQEKNPEVIILSQEMSYDSRGDLRITGMLQNNAGKTLSYVEVKGKFYDSKRLVLESTSDSINDLANGEIWKFSLLYSEYNPLEVKDYQVEVGEYW